MLTISPDIFYRKESAYVRQSPTEKPSVHHQQSGSSPRIVFTFFPDIIGLNPVVKEMCYADDDHTDEHYPAERYGWFGSSKPANTQAKVK